MWNLSVFKKVLKNIFIFVLCILISSLSMLTISGKVYATSNAFLSDDVINKFVNLFYKAGSEGAERVNNILSGKEEGTYEDFKEIFGNISAFYGVIDDSFSEIAASDALSSFSLLNNVIKGCIQISDNVGSLDESTNAIQKTVDGFQILEGAMTLLGCGSYFPSGLSLVLNVTEITINIAGFLETQYFKENVSFYEADLQIAYFTGDILPLPNAPEVIGFGTLTQEKADSIYAQLYMKYYAKQMMQNVGGSSSGGSDNKVYITEVSLSEESVELAMNTTVDLAIGYSPVDANTDTGITLSSSNKSVATVNSDGVIIPVGIGTVNIVATSDNGVKASCKVTVHPYKVSKNGTGYTIDDYLGSSKNLTIPKSFNNVNVTRIGGKAFINCTSLTSINIPNTVTSIGNDAFAYCKNLKLVNMSDNITSIEKYAFYDCEVLTSITIPDSVISIGECAFLGCGLTSITLPNSVKSIGNKIFSDCGNLSSIILSDNITSIGDGAFEYCRSLNSIIIPNGVTSIGKNAFYDCENLVSIKIPNSLTSIGYGAFEYCESLTSITIPNSVTSIGDYAFGYCKKIPSVTIPCNVTNIGGNAFIDCTSLTAITVDENNVNYASVDGVLFNKDKTILIKYPSNKADNKYVIPNGVINIDEDAFRYSLNLTSVSIPDSVTTIDYQAFIYCKNLLLISLGKGVATIGRNAFSNCTSLTAINVDENNANYLSVDGVLFNKDMTQLIKHPSNKDYSEFTISDNVTNIGEYAFEDCENLTLITIPNSVTKIGGSAFADCSALEAVEIPNNVIEIGSMAFVDCSALVNVKLPSSLSVVSSSVFLRCVSLKNIVIPEGVTEISIGAFRGCEKLANVILPSTLTTIGKVSTSILGSGLGFGVFSDCISLKKIIIPDSVTSIGDRTFENCTNLSSITIPESLTKIGKGAFLNCNALTNIFYCGLLSDWDNITIGSNNDCLINATISHICTYGDWDTSLPTCTKDGSRSKTCLVCGDVVIEPLVATGHDYSTEWTIDVAPTCTTEGSKSHHCTVCGDKADITVIEATGHNYEVQSTENIHPHTTTYKCSFCEDSKTETQYVSDCYECIYGKEPPIQETPDTKIDYTNLVIRTSVESTDEISDILGLTENAIVSVAPSHKYGVLELYGTGTIITVFDGNKYVGDFTLIVEGDTNGDSICDALDAAQVALASNGHETLDGAYAMAADSNEDDMVDINDYQQIVNKAVA